METTGQIVKILQNRPTIEGAGVRLRRVFGHDEVPLLDPFLLLDDFGSENPDDYLAGFPWHPHRGIETVTYMLHGEVEHADSIGNQGIIHSGDVQWMTAGSGIIHHEMPQKYHGRMRGFQLWINLPASRKMIDPHYQEVKKDQIPALSPSPNVTVKIICGEIDGTLGPVQDLAVETEYLDIVLSPHSEYERQIKAGFKVFAYVIEGNAHFGSEPDKAVPNGHLALFSDCDRVKIFSREGRLRLLLISGRPLNEPVAWQGPIVMNTQAELDLAFEEYKQGNFIKSG